MPLPTAADCWPVVADRRPSPLAPRCRPPWRAGHLSEVRGAKITAFSVPTNFSLRNLSPARRVITAEGTAAAEGHRRPKALPPNGPPPGSPQNRRAPAAAEALSSEGGITVEWPAARKPAELPCSRCRGGIVARRTAAGGTVRPQVLRPEEHRTSAADRRNCQPVEVARYRVSPSNRWLKSSCGAGM